MFTRPNFKVRQKTNLQPYLPLLAAIATLILSAPAAYALLRRPPTTKTFLYALATTGLRFFVLFSSPWKEYFGAFDADHPLILEIPSKAILLLLFHLQHVALLEKDGLKFNTLYLCVYGLYWARRFIKSQGVWITRAVLLGGAVCQALPCWWIPRRTCRTYGFLYCVFILCLFGLFYLYLSSNASRKVILK